MKRSKLGFFSSFQDMEEHFKQVRLQDRQDEKILENKYNTKVSILIVVFFPFSSYIYTFQMIVLSW